MKKILRSKRTEVIKSYGKLRNEEVNNFHSLSDNNMFINSTGMLGLAQVAQKGMLGLAPVAQKGMSGLAQ
jgi:hypothetical protein